MKKLWNVILILTLLPIAFSGCSPIEKTHAPTQTASTKVTPPADTASETEVSRPSPSRTRSISPTPSAEKTMITPTVLPTMTFVPVLPAAEAEKSVIRLLSKNGDCRLPCFWGIVPGETRLQQFRSKLNEFYKLQSGVLFGDIGGGMEIILTRNGVILETWLSAVVSKPTQSDKIRRLEVAMTAYKELETMQDPVYGNADYLDYFQYYALPNLLSMYGPPRNIFVEIDLGAQALVWGEDKFFLHLDYSHQGWVATITMPASPVRDNRYEGCPYIGLTSLQLWAPGDTEMMDTYGFDERFGYPWSLEDATGYEEENFFQKFKTPTHDCLEINLDELKFPQ